MRHSLFCITLVVLFSAVYSVTLGDAVDAAYAYIDQLSASVHEPQGAVELPAAKDAFQGFMQVLKTDGESTAPLILGSTWRKLGAGAFNKLNSIADESQRREVLVAGLSVKPRLTKEMWGNMMGFVIGRSLKEEILAYDGPITGYGSELLFAGTLLQLNQLETPPFSKATARVEALMVPYAYLDTKSSGFTAEELHALGILSALGHVPEEIAIQRITAAADASSDTTMLGSAVAGLYMLGPETDEAAGAIEARLRQLMQNQPTPTATP